MLLEPENTSLADILGPWLDPQFESGLIKRCKNAWNKPLPELTNEELATLPRQKIAIVHILPIAKARVTEQIDDDTEMFEGELQEAVENTEGTHLVLRLLRRSKTSLQCSNNPRQPW